MIKRFMKLMIERSGRRIISENAIPFGMDLALDLSRVMKPAVRVIADVGANTGQTVKRFSSMWPDAKIHSFEPTPDLFPMLEQACSSTTNSTAYNIALGSSTNRLPFYCYSQSQCNSFTLNPDLPVVKEIDIPVHTLSAWMEAAKVENIDLLKIDVEGAECEVLRGAVDAMQRGKIHSILAEISLYPDDHSHTHFEDLRTMMASSGYYFIAFYGQFNRRDNHQFIYADALFVQREAIRNSGIKAVMPVDCVGFGK